MGPSADQRSFGGNIRSIVLADRRRPDVSGSFEYRSKTDDVVPPENRLEFAEGRFGQVGAFADRAIVHAADFERERVGLRSDEQVRTDAAELAGEAVADIESDAEGGPGERPGERQHC